MSELNDFVADKKLTKLKRVYDFLEELNSTNIFHLEDFFLSHSDLKIVIEFKKISDLAECEDFVKTSAELTGCLEIVATKVEKSADFVIFKIKIK
jgi:hypothetical protein